MESVLAVHVAGYIDIFASDTYQDSPNLFIVDQAAQANTTLRKFFRKSETIDADVNSMINKITTESNAMANKTTIRGTRFVFQQPSRGLDHNTGP